MELHGLMTGRSAYVKERVRYKNRLSGKRYPPDSQSYKRMKGAIAFLDGLINEEEEQASHLIENSPELKRHYDLLVSIKGISFVNAINTIIYTDDFSAFENARQYAEYIGVAPHPNSSGTSVKGRKKVSKICASKLKADLSEAASASIRYDPEIALYIRRKAMEGKETNSIKNAVKFKLVCRMFAVIRRGTPFVTLMRYQA